MKKFNTIFFGTPKFVTCVLETIASSPKIELVCVVTSPDQKVGRRQILTPSDVALHTPPSAILLKPEKLDDEFAQQLRQLQPDLFVVAAYGKIIPRRVLDIPNSGAINIHPSLLPKYRGASPIQSAILAGDTKTGITFIKMDHKMDHGPIIYQEDYPLTPYDTCENLSEGMFSQAATLILEVVKNYLQSPTQVTPQNDTKATFCKLISKEDGYFDIDNPPAPDMLDRMMRAYYPWPTAWTKWNGKIVKLYPHKMIQIEGKGQVTLKEFLNGYPTFPLRDGYLTAQERSSD